MNSRTPFTVLTLQDYKDYIIDNWKRSRRQEKREDPRSHYHICGGCMWCGPWDGHIHKEYEKMTLLQKQALAYKHYQKQQGLKRVLKALNLRVYLPRLTTLHQEIQ